MLGWGPGFYFSLVSHVTAPVFKASLVITNRLLIRCPRLHIGINGRTPGMCIDIARCLACIPYPEQITGLFCGACLLGGVGALSSLLVHLARQGVRKLHT